MSGRPRADIKFFGKGFLYFNHFFKSPFKIHVYRGALTHVSKKTLWLSLGSNQYLAGRVYDLMRIMTGSTKSGSGEASAVISFFEALVGAYNCVCLCAL